MGRLKALHAWLPGYLYRSYKPSVGFSLKKGYLIDSFAANMETRQRVVYRRPNG